MLGCGIISNINNYPFFLFNALIFIFLLYIIFLCTVILLDGAGIRQQLGFDDHHQDSDFSDEENIGGGK